MQDDWIDLVKLKSDKFIPLSLDTPQVDPSFYGAELAYWLAKKLAIRGIVTSYPNYKDLGWHLDYVTDERAKFAIHCGNVDSEENVWSLTLRRYPHKFFGRDKPSFDKASVLIHAIREVLVDAEIETIDWHCPLTC